MNFEFNYYKILGLRSNASQKNIDDAYTNFKKNKEHTASKWQCSQIEDAYKVLSDPKLKKEYDAFWAAKDTHSTIQNSNLNKFLKNLKNYICDNKITCILILGIFTLGCLNIYHIHCVKFLQRKLQSVEYEINQIQYTQIHNLQKDMATLKIEVKEISDIQSSIYGLNRNNSTTAYNIDRLKDAHNELVQYIKCLGSSFCISRGKLVTLY